MGTESSSPIDPALRIASVRLAVGELSRSVDFYGRVLGLPLISLDPDQALLGPVRSRPALVLTGVERPEPIPPGSTGLFHVAWLHPSRAALAASVRRIAHSRWPIDGAADHGVSEALYLSDPDGLGIEIYSDRPRERWDRPADGHGVKMVTLPLDLDDLLAQAGTELTPTVPADTAIGHVHLKVSDVPRSATFYRDALGFEEQAMLPSAAFLSAGGYHHHVGMNSWHSRAGGAPPDNAPGLRGVEFELAHEDALRALKLRWAETQAEAETGGDSSPAHETDGRLTLRDPDGHALGFSDVSARS
ncbi:MAG TPA: VOC family protein [Solirubrobacteraceae bacterium]|jgi:catechol 2,3-dioxygenase